MQERIPVEAKYHYFGPKNQRILYRLSPQGHVAMLSQEKLLYRSRGFQVYCYLSGQGSRETCQRYGVAPWRWEHLR